MIVDRNSCNSCLMYCSSTGPTVEDMHVMPFQVGSIERQISRRLSRPAGYILHDFEQETAADMPIGLTSRGVLQKSLSSSGKGSMLQSEKAAGIADSKRPETIMDGRRSSCHSSSYDPNPMKKSPRMASFDSGEARKSPRTTNTDVGDVKRAPGKNDSIDAKRSSGSGGVESCSAPRILPRSGLSDSDAALNQAASTCGVQESKKTCIAETPCAGDGQVPGCAGVDEEPVSCRVACQSWAGQKNGIKKANQDAYCFMRSVDRRFLVFGVFDGHGTNGHHVARFVKENLPQCLLKQPTVLLNPGLAFTEAFAAVDRSLESSVECSVSGTTAVMAQIQERTLTLAWAGDSRAVIGKTGDDGIMEALPLSIDHKPDVKAEKQRIVENNGRVDRLLDQFGDEVGPYRVWLRNAPILGLAMSRSLGDVLAHTVGVSAEPEICTYNLTSQDRFLILASDGVWEFISSEEAVKIVSDSPTPESGCKKLMMTARSRWLGLDHGCYVDDITAMVIGFTHH
eukprot:TRINITY_DN19459_c0_g1_i1.p1 TRINITY_DN19459_c0_g1~~TRINITY_DN19459_c0_g1_i1.p1  ORF type:complete len:511 (+),score=60.88 TRINITY_DN19459_c0_g1_i1:394-1926(+)